jgi:glycerophosphoryl diester phosphodiesterase
MIDDWPSRAMPELPRVIGHRGAAAVAPENTLVSLRRAKELGAAWVEFDVKLTRDGAAVLMHDERLERTTDGQGEVARITLAELRKLDAGAWFAPGFAGEPVPTLTEALALCGELGLGVNVEIKPCAGREAETARVAVETLHEFWPEDRPAPLISSFAPVCLAVARDLAPAMPRGYLAGRLPPRWQQQLEAYGCGTLHLNDRRTSARQRAAVLAAGVPLLLYTVNDPGRARELLEAGVTALFTDRVGEVLRALGEGVGACASSGASGRSGGPAP